jgi:two-component system sensor histidine kinase/response regulator
MEPSSNPLTPPPIAVLPNPEASLKPTLLVVDDEEGPRMSLKVIFGDTCKVLLADSGKAAVELAQANKIDVAVLDIRMAGMSGIEVLERLKFIDPTIEVVMMTAYAETETVRQALRLRACDYISKPFDVSTIRKSVTMALERRSLNGEVLQNAEKLEALQKELEQQKMDEEMARTRGEIYASIIHDINSPLTIISGLIQIINQRIGGETKVEGEELEQVKDRLKRITRQVTNCIEISRRYLGFLRQSPSEAAKVWVNQILADVGELLRVHPAARSNQLVITPLAQDVTGLVNGTDLIQILLNLALNGMQCSQSPHKVEIRCEVKQEPLRLDLLQDGPQDRLINREGFANAAPLLAISVQDNGPGMPPEVLGKIFQPYFTTKGKSNGTGLGLCIVHRLLKECRGGLHVHTSAGQGTTFTIYLQARI